MANSLRTPSIAPTPMSFSSFRSSDIGGIRNPTPIRDDNKYMQNVPNKEWGQYADTMRELYNVKAQATLKELDNNFFNKAEQSLYSENGYLQTKKKNAIDGYNKALEQLDKDFNETKTGTEDQLVQNLFEQGAKEKLNVYKDRMQKHLVQETANYNIAESNARIANLAQVTARDGSNWNVKDSEYNKNFKALIVEAEENLRLNQIDPQSQEGQNFLRKTINTVHKTVLSEYLANDDIRGAQAYFNANSAGMEYDSAVQFHNHIKNQQDILEHKALRKAYETGLASGNTVNTLVQTEDALSKKKLNELDELYSKGKLSQEEYFEAVDKENLRHTQALGEIQTAHDVAKASKDKMFMSYRDLVGRLIKDPRMQERINNHEIHSIEDVLPTSAYAEIKGKKYEKYLNDIYFHGIAESSKAILTQLRAMTKEQRQALKSSELTDLRWRMTSDDWKTYEKLRHKDLHDDKVSIEDQKSTYIDGLVNEYGGDKNQVAKDYLDTYDAEVEILQGKDNKALSATAMVQAQKIAYIKTATKYAENKSSWFGSKGAKTIEVKDEIGNTHTYDSRFLSDNLSVAYNAQRTTDLNNNEFAVMNDSLDLDDIVLNQSITKALDDKVNENRR